eukprot:scaffold1531_cov296-Prasinococcus_capsulatus_cf.AAC.17
MNDQPTNSHAADTSSTFSAASTSKRSSWRTVGTAAAQREPSAGATGTLTLRTSPPSSAVKTEGSPALVLARSSVSLDDDSVATVSNGCVPSSPAVIPEDSSS